MISLAQERGGGSERNAAEMNDFLFFLTRASRSAFPRRKIPETAHASPCFNARTRGAKPTEEGAAARLPSLPQSTAQTRHRACHLSYLDSAGREKRLTRTKVP